MQSSGTVLVLVQGIVPVAQHSSHLQTCCLWLQLCDQGRAG